MMTTERLPIIEFHILQSFPVTCLNRDDVGAPKTAMVGGVTRARVSSQCWKRQVRLAMQDFGVTLATRTRHVQKLLADACRNAGANEQQATECAASMADVLSKLETPAPRKKKVKDDQIATDDSDKNAADDNSDALSKTLLFISDNEAEAFADYAKKNNFDFSGGDAKENADAKKEAKKRAEKLKKELSEVAKNASKPTDDPLDSLDIALFGRMVASAPDMSIEAAASFSHAISTHKVSNEVEFFTALDDLQTEPGSAHMGSLEYNSATYYRYISLNMNQLQQTLGGENADSEDIKKAVSAFTKALFVATPAARQTTQSGASPWEYARVLVRQGQRLQVPFESPVKPTGQQGYLQASVEKMKDYLDKKEKLCGSLFGKVGSYDWGEDENFSIDDLIERLQNHVVATSA